MGPAAKGRLPRRLLEVATRLFADHGFEGTSVRQIVEAAGVTKGALYHYFGSKDDLLREIYGRVLRVQTERLERFIAIERPVVERLSLAATDVVLTSIANLDDTKIFFRSMHQLNAGSRQAVRAERRRYHERFRTLVEEGQTAGVLRADVSADLVVDFFFGSVHHLGAWYRHDGALPAQQIADQFTRLLLTSLKPAN